MSEAAPEIVARYYDFVLWMQARIARFPRQQRQILGERFEDKILMLLEELVALRYSKDKLERLKRANIDLEVLRYYIRLAKDLGLFSVKQQEHAITLLFGVGQGLGGWIKQQEQLRSGARA